MSGACIGRQFVAVSLVQTVFLFSQAEVIIEKLKNKTFYQGRHEKLISKQDTLLGNETIVE